MRQAKDYIIFPLDVPEPAEAKRYVELLSGYVGMFKVGLELFIRSGPEIVKLIKAAGRTGIFLDLKLHDIPETVMRAMASVAELGIRFATVHCGEVKGMLEAAVKGGNRKVGVLGVTLLTSVSKEDIRNSGYRDEFISHMSALVMKKAAMAESAGCAGVVCSGKEVNMIKNAFGKDFITVTPGIRPAWEGMGRGDQRRVTTPSEAVKNGSDYLVIGRPIRDASDPRAAAIRIAKEINETIVTIQ